MKSVTAQPEQTHIINVLSRMQEVPQDEGADMKEEADGGQAEGGGDQGRGTDQEPLLDKKQIGAAYTMAFIIVCK